MMDLVSNFSQFAKTFFRVASSIFLPHIGGPEERDFVEENRKHWFESNAADDGCTAILVETALSTPASLLEKFLIAKTIEQKTDARVVAILNAAYPQASSAYFVAQSFGVSRFICWWRGYANPLLVGRAIIFTLALILLKRSGRNLLDLRINGIHIGDLIYDTLIRYRPNHYTVGGLRFSAHFRLIFRAIFNFYSSQALFQKFKVRAIVTSHNVYAEFGILCRIAHWHGATIFLKDMDVFRLYDRHSNVYEHFLRTTHANFLEAISDPSVITKAEAYFNQRLSGKIDQVDLSNAYIGKKIYSKTEFLDMLGADPSKKNVFVLAHAFSDAPHVGGEMAFDDYFDWLRQTIERLSQNQNVNVIVKPHPSSYMWGEKGVVEMLLDQLGISNIFITPSDLNTLSIKDIADYVVTVRGTAGLEYSGFGIPAITCGEGYYSGFGIALEHSNRQAYFETLDNIISIQPLAEGISLRARVLLYITFTKLSRSALAPARHLYPGDDADALIPLHFKEMSTNLREMGLIRDKFMIDVEKAVASAF